MYVYVYVYVYVYYIISRIETWDLDRTFYFPRPAQFVTAAFHYCHGETLLMDSALQTHLSIEEHSQPRDEGLGAVRLHREEYISLS